MEDRASKIMQCYKEPCVFSYYPGLNLDLSNSTEIRMGRGEIDNKFLTGELGVSDMFIVQAIMHMQYATVPMINRYLQNSARLNPQKMVMGYDDVSALKSRLGVLERSGCVRCASYITRSNKKVNIYWVSELGALASNMSLATKDSYGPMNSVRYLPEKLKLLLSAYVGVFLASNKYCQEFNCMEDFKVNRINKAQIYAKLYYKDESGRKALVLVEPFYYSMQNEIKSDYENERDIKQRIVMLAGYLDYVEDMKSQGKEVYQDVRYIGVVEDIDGLKKTMALIEDVSPSLFEHISFVTQSVIHAYNSDINERGKCFTKIVKKEGKGLQAVLDTTDYMGNWWS